ncbi:hypothetical protein QRD02_08665 [Aequorivita sp. SDUM287046]|uniref:3-methyladenine DNA glycosylase n=1 Tax=Aequorivita aurantiaca TaxID=3053356 RepID=A0ABT8DI48_9FLAO|nr:hypothetical protein [Aequorivita aurantiaca]MDN3724454.1 hypothetical protein [Aequorivita aurantiaca]
MKNSENNPKFKPQQAPNKGKKTEEEEIDEQLEQTFPASDPPSYSQPGNDLDKKKEKES